MNKEDLKLFSGRANPSLSKNIAEFLKMPLGNIEIREFADGEVYVNIKESVRGKDVFVIQPICKPINNNLIELLIIIDALKRASAMRITAVIPYFGYARQDKKLFFVREPITAKLVANLITAAGVDRIITVDLHSGQIQGFFDVPLDNLYGMPLFVNYISEKNLKNMVVVSPDAGAVKKSERLATSLDIPLAILDKRRKEHNIAITTHVIGDVKGKTALIIDDMIDTGGTICEAVKILFNNGVKEVYVMATHPVLSEPATSRLREANIKEVIFTDSILLDNKDKPSKFKVVSIAPLLAKTIESVHGEGSVSKLFENY